MAATARSRWSSALGLQQYMRHLCPPQPRRTLILPAQYRSLSSLPPPHIRLNAVASHRLEAERRAHYQRRSYYAAGGVAVCTLATLLLVTVTDIPRKERNDAPSRDPLNAVQPGTPVIRRANSIDEANVGNARAQGGNDAVTLAATGTSTVPTFPRMLKLPDGNDASSKGKTEYQLLGLGIRTVSFLGIQVYVVGLYVATEDVALLQRALMRKIDSAATTLIGSEKDHLRSLLLDPDKSEDIWQTVLKEGGIRTAIRVVPVRNTDFQHLRDGWVRGITTRTTNASAKGHDSFDDEGFGRAMQDFKGIFSGGFRKNVPKGKVLLLMRDGLGKLTVWYDNLDKVSALLQMGVVDDERVSRLVWLGYLAGKKVATEGARTSIVDGLMDIVERPIGTVAAQVV